MRKRGRDYTNYWRRRAMRAERRERDWRETWIRDFKSVREVYWKLAAIVETHGGKRAR